MIHHHLKIITRNLRKSKLVTLINLLGITIGFTVSILLFIYVKHELETDKSLPGVERIYRVESESGYYQSLPKINVIKNNVPGIKHVTYFHSSWSVYDIVKYNNNNIILGYNLFADSSFFRVFQYNSIFGDAQNGLKHPYSIVLTQTESQRIFGDENPVGKTIEIQSTGRGTHVFTVTAVVEDPPSNASVKFKSVLSLATYFQFENYKSNQNHWGYNNYATFALLNNNTPKEKTEETINLAMDSKAPEWVKEYYGEYHLACLSGLYFSATDNGDEIANGKLPVVILMAVIGFVILLIAGINYFNLAIAQFEKRILEIGINRSVGAAAKNISFQSFLETILISSIALVSSIGLIKLALPFFNQLTGIQFNFAQLLQSGNLLLIAVLFFVAMAVFGLLPALVVGRQNVIDILRGKNKIQHSHEGFRNGMVVFQFALAIALVGASIVLYKQSQFLLHSDYGFDKENVLCIRFNSDMDDSKAYLEEEFARFSNVQQIAYGANHLGHFSGDWGMTCNFNGESLKLTFDQLYVSGDLFGLLNIDMVSGRTFNESSSRKGEVIVNQSFVDKYGIDDKSEFFFPLGGNGRGRLVGVVDDFHYGSMYHNIKPMVYVCSNSNGSIMYVKLASASIVKTKETITSFKKIWERSTSLFPFNYTFLDDNYKKIYEAEINLMKIIMIASGLSIFIACLGLFGIAMYLTEKRTKEIGVRKVNGAQVHNILLHFNQSFVVKICVAFIIASPVVYFLTFKWLEGFAYKTSIGFWPFIIAGSIVMLTALLTVSWHSWAVARKNPVEALRYE